MSNPFLRVPDFDADGCTNNHHFAAGIQSQELPEAIRQDYPAAFCNRDQLMPSGKQSSQFLDVRQFLVQFAGLDFGFHQTHSVIQTLLPAGGAPDAQAARLLLGQDALLSLRCQ